MRAAAKNHGSAGEIPDCRCLLGIDKDCKENGTLICLLAESNARANVDLLGLGFWDVVRFDWFVFCCFSSVRIYTKGPHGGCSEVKNPLPVLLTGCRGS